ncbi:MAG: UDP-N-acetylmuramate: L-alanyl-gamma-D-glutamyl-meso-diaminopimelate ligase [Halieaceae bacterium]
MVLLHVFKESCFVAQHIHILGICGTFMGGLALLARELGYEVSGSDANVYPPMSTQLEAQGIELMEGYSTDHLRPAPDLVVIGNAMTRGNPSVEYVLDQGMAYTSGPAWLADHVLQGRWVLAIAGTHGKTTTSSMVAWLLEQAGMEPGFLIGGVPADFGVSARLGNTPFFVVEADEYDSAFFDKRSKFVHYRPRTLVINNIEFDHADIFDDLEAIQRQFHHVVRTVPGTGLIIHRDADSATDQVLAMGCWSELQSFSADNNPAGSWRAELESSDGSIFRLQSASPPAATTVSWPYCGRHNVENGLAAAAAAHHVGVTLADIGAGLSSFGGVKRRMEVIGKPGGVTVYDDFAHHPTAIASTLQGLRNKIESGRILALIEPRSKTMRLGQHRDQLAESVAAADQILWYQPPGMDWSLQDIVIDSPKPAVVYSSIEAMVSAVSATVRPGDHVVIMSNGSFGGVYQQILKALERN